MREELQKLSESSLDESELEDLRKRLVTSWAERYQMRIKVSFRQPRMPEFTYALNWLHRLGKRYTSGFKSVRSASGVKNRLAVSYEQTSSYHRCS